MKQCCCCCTTEVLQQCCLFAAAALQLSAAVLQPRCAAALLQQRCCCAAPSLHAAALHQCSTDAPTDAVMQLLQAAFALLHCCCNAAAVLLQQPRLQQRKRKDRSGTQANKLAQSTDSYPHDLAAALPFHGHNGPICQWGQQHNLLPPSLPILPLPIGRITLWVGPNNEINLNFIPLFGLKNEIYNKKMYFF
jgi:hypothetical protein